MRVTRKFNLGRVGHQYESLEIEVEAYSIEKAAEIIEESWKTYRTLMKEGKIQ